MITNTSRNLLALIPLDEDCQRIRLDDTAVCYTKEKKIVKLIIENDTFYQEIDYDIPLENELIKGRAGTKGKPITRANILKVKTKKARLKMTKAVDKLALKIGVEHFKVLYFDHDKPLDEQLPLILENEYGALSIWQKQLAKALKQAKIRKTYRVGDIFSFPVADDQYGFALIIGAFQDYRKKNRMPQDSKHFMRLLMTVPIFVRVFDYVSPSNVANVELLQKQPLLNPEAMMDDDVLRGVLPVVGHKPLIEEDVLLPMSYSYNGKQTTYWGYSAYGQPHHQLLAANPKEITVRFDWGFASVTMSARDFIRRNPHEVEFLPNAGIGGGPKSYNQYLTGKREAGLLKNPNTIFDEAALEKIWREMGISQDCKSFADFNRMYGGIDWETYQQIFCP
ncbi:immunity 26/phosphotriesterase HocA family protein [Listeria costaricensis]|uniref:immunity 26/phosphotriesterase HocA family protein n=1 Tax=Listeria costaricensis TaxID=2026604 RepID=UPI0013C45FF5|nr:immunity 26/phosphotriesterase HocA family protein [Listeria costaricensis]